MKNFFIYTLPRSGSAWLAVFLTAFDSYCYHEPLADMDVNTLEKKMSGRPDWVVGAVDTGAYRYLPVGVVKGDLKARPFVLRRSIRDVQASASAFGVRYDAAAESGHLANVVGDATPIEFEELFNVHYLKDLWAEMIGTPFDLERAQMFVEMNIQRDPRKFFNNRPQLQSTGQGVLPWH